MQVDDWRNATVREVGELYERERQRWLDALGWDSAASWAITEEGRRAGRLAGFLARDARGLPVGWTVFALRDGTLQIGTLCGRAEVVRELLEATLAAPEASLARRYQCFMFPESAAVEAALTRRRFDVEQYRYRERLAVSAAPPAPPEGLVPWTEEDLPGTARLLARAYAGSPTASSFAPNARLDEWAGYLAQVVRTPACGAYMPEASWKVPSSGRDWPDAIVLTTRLSPGTAHVVQVVVDPDRRRSGLASGLVLAAASSASEAGARALTLLVAAGNAPAQALYDRLGFVERATFVLAGRDRITRVAATRAGAGVAAS